MSADEPGLRAHANHALTELAEVRQAIDRAAELAGNPGVSPTHMDAAATLANALATLALAERVDRLLAETVPADG
jgi:hypothetical protein